MELKLKTLKDLDINYMYGRGAFEKLLKAEAIKWRKEFMKAKPQIMIRDWDDFFNITEEDLK